MNCKNELLKNYFAEDATRTYSVSLFFNEKSTVELSNFILQVAQITKNDYVVKNNIPPHITIGMFKATKNQEGQLVEIIKKINSDYVDKITQKSIEAQKIINQKEQELQEKYALELKDKIARYIQKKLSKMLDSINQLSRVLAVEPQNDELKKYLMGFKMILAEFENSLVEMDIATVNVKIGDIFDETIMTAFEVVELPGFSSDTVVEVISPAYKYEDKIIKHAVVKVQK